MTKCSVDLSCNSKLLLKVLTCLWNQYVKGHIQFTQLYQAEPSADGYVDMLQELEAIFASVKNNFALRKLDLCPGQNSTYVELIVSDVYGDVVYYNTDAPVTFDSNSNTFANAATADIVPFSLGTNKPVQRLNVDECLENAYQINPEYLTDGSGNYYSATSATIVGRTGCAGVANTGFIELTLIVDNTCFPVPSCVKGNCCV